MSDRARSSAGSFVALVIPQSAGVAEGDNDGSCSAPRATITCGRNRPLLIVAQGSTSTVHGTRGVAALPPSAREMGKTRTRGPPALSMPETWDPDETLGVTISGQGANDAREATPSRRAKAGHSSPIHGSHNRASTNQDE